MTETRDDKWLVRACLRGDLDAFGQLVERYQRPIFNAAFRIVGNYEDAEDVTQTVFVKAYQNLAQYKHKYKFFSWIYRMVVNESINFLSRARKTTILDVATQSPRKGPHEQYVHKELEERIQGALLRLAPEYRVLIILRHFEELSYREIAYILDLPERKVKARLFRARQMLKEILSTKGVTAHD